MMCSITAVLLIVFVSPAQGHAHVAQHKVHDTSFRARSSFHAASQGTAFRQHPLPGVFRQHPLPGALLMPQLRSGLPRLHSLFGLHLRRPHSTGQSAPLTEEDVKRLEKQKVRTPDDWIEQVGKWNILLKAKNKGGGRWTAIAAKQIQATAEAARITADKAQSTAELVGMKKLEAAADVWRLAAAAWQARELGEVAEAREWTDGATKAAVAAARETVSAARATAEASAEASAAEQSKGWMMVADAWEEAAVGLSEGLDSTSQQGHGSPELSAQNLAPTPAESVFLYGTSTYALITIAFIAVSFAMVCHHRGMPTTSEELFLLPDN